MKVVCMLGADEPLRVPTKEEIEAVQNLLSETCNDPNMTIVTSSPSLEWLLREMSIYHGIWEETRRLDHRRENPCEPMLLIK